MTRAGLLVSLALVLTLVGLGWWLRSGLVEQQRSGSIALSTAPNSSDHSSVEPHSGPELEKVGANRVSPPLSSGDRSVVEDLPVFHQERKRPGTGRKKIAIVIDDLGRSVRMVEGFLALETPMSFAVLPFETRTPQVVDSLHAANAEVLCHLPMEGLAGADPGPGALLASMTEGELKMAATAALDAVAGARGVNNHMGSVLSADPAAMHAILEVIAERGQFFLDSRTSADSVGFAMARSLGLPAAERQVFLDGDPAPAAIKQQFERALSIAQERGFAIAIGHPYASTLEVLADELPRARKLGFELVRVSELLEADASTGVYGPGSSVERSLTPGS